MLNEAQAKLQYGAQRAKVSLGGLVRDELFGRLEKLNDELRGLLGDSDEHDAMQLTAALRPTASAMAALLQFWRHASSIHTLLLSSWQCVCKSSRRLDLLLQYRTTAEVDFTIFVRLERSLPTSCNWDQQQARIVKA